MIFLIALTSCVVSSVHGFSSSSLSLIKGTTRLFSSLPSSPPQEQTLDNYLPPEHPLYDLITATTEAVQPRKLDTTEDAHEAFRYEWGTWCSNEKLETVMSALDNIRIYTDAYEDLLNGS